jgi:putative SOS response-associated peptidase YedK
VNARVETAASRPTFADAWRRGRCVVPADGFYEWAGPAQARRPHFVHAADAGLLFLAGLFLGGPEREPDHGLHFCILTRAADPVVAAVHDRMPVVLSRAALGPWLDGAPPGPTPDRALVVRAVGPAVNDPRFDDPSCLAPAPPDPQRSLW